MLGARACMRATTAATKRVDEPVARARQLRQAGIADEIIELGGRGRAWCAFPSVRETLNARLVSGYQAEADRPDRRRHLHAWPKALLAGRAGAASTRRTASPS